MKRNIWARNTANPAPKKIWKVGTFRAFRSGRRAGRIRLARSSDGGRDVGDEAAEDGDVGVAADGRADEHRAGAVGDRRDDGEEVALGLAQDERLGPEPGTGSVRTGALAVSASAPSMTAAATGEGWRRRSTMSKGPTMIRTMPAPMPSVTPSSRKRKAMSTL